MSLFALPGLLAAISLGVLAWAPRRGALARATDRAVVGGPALERPEVVTVNRDG
jgi:hypothetical protein